MARVENTVFLSYRRTDVAWALAVFQNLTQCGYDVFFDYEGLAGGDFARTIVENIKARAHFLVLLTPAALERCDQPADWLRREIETALESGRNVVPLALDGFDFDAPPVVARLSGSLAPLKSYNSLRIPPDYFSEAMERLREKFLSMPLDAVLHPASQVAERVVKEQQRAAQNAIDSQGRRLAVRVHRASFVGESAVNYFVNLTNLSPQRPIEVTHVWYENGPDYIPIHQPSRPLPARLELDQSWETWIAEAIVSPEAGRDVSRCFRARISTGEVFESSPSANVPPIGTVPGPRIDYSAAGTGDQQFDQRSPLRTTSPAKPWYAQLLERRGWLGALPILVLVASAAAFWGLSAPIRRDTPPGVSTDLVPRDPVQDAPSDPPDFGTVLLSEDFRDNRNSWREVSNSHRRFDLSDGHYTMSSETADGQIATIPVNINQESDFQIRCRVTKRSGEDGFGFGLVWGKKDDNNFLDFAIRGQGSILIATRQNGQFEDHVDVALLNQHVRRGNATNRLVVRKEGQRIRFFVNGYQVHEMPPQPFFGDGVGFMVFNSLNVDFDDLVVTTK